VRHPNLYIAIPVTASAQYIQLMMALALITDQNFHGTLPLAADPWQTLAEVNSGVYRVRA